MNGIKAIIFDLGGVLIDLDIERCRAAFKEILGYGKIDELLDPCHQKGIYSDLEEGILTENEFKELILHDSVPGATPEDVDRAMAALLTGICPEKVQLLKNLARKYPLYLLSNNNSISMKRSRKIFEDAGIPMDEIFSGLFLSYSMKMLKPSEKIYRETAVRIGLPVHELLFIDDSESNVSAASSVGFNAVLYHPGSDLEKTVFSVLEVM